MVRTVLLLLADRGLGRRGGRRSIVNRQLRLMRMRGVEGRRGYVRQGRRHRGRLMMIVMMMNAASRVESISALVDARRRRRGRQAGGSAAQNRGARRAAAGHGAAGHGYGWKTALGDYAVLASPGRDREMARRCRRIIDGGFLRRDRPAVTEPPSFPERPKRTTGLIVESGRKIRTVTCVEARRLLET